MKFTKPPLTFQEQVNLLKSRNLIIHSESAALNQLKNINYYRLSAYRFPFCEINNKDYFKSGVTFDMLWNLYCFDRELRLHLLDAIERIEVGVRTRWSNYLAIKYGSHGYENGQIFSDEILHQKLLDEVDFEVNRSHEEFIKSYLCTYTEPQRPSIWAITEILSFGALSKFYSNLKFRQDRKKIADDFFIDEVVLRSFLLNLTVIRNFCAHHARLWNRKFPTELTYPKHLDSSFNKSEPKKIYNNIVLILHFMKILCPNSTWKIKLLELINNCQEVNPKDMGFPNNWQALEIWNGQRTAKI